MAKKTAEEAQEDLLNSLLDILKTRQRPGESHLQTLERVVAESGWFLGLAGDGEARFLVVEHLGPGHTSFDTGGQYAVRHAVSEKGRVCYQQQIHDLGPGAKPTPSMAWHVANDHLTDRIDRWLKPEAYR
jgi:hypothetical protein